MTVDMNDPASIRAWVAIAPERHRGTLRGLRLLPLFKPMLDQVMTSATAGAKSAAPSATSSGTTPATAQGDHHRGALL